MRPYVLVTGDFVETGGMDAANLGLATFLARQGREVHLVCHRAADELLRFPNVRVHYAQRPWESHFLGAPFLDREGRLVARQLARQRPHVIVNGGNCQAGTVNWVHFVHAAWLPAVAGGPVRRTKQRIVHAVSVRDERRALAKARLIIANSKQTREAIFRLYPALSVPVETVYLGTAPGRFQPASEQDRAAAAKDFKWNPGRKRIVFLGSLGDRRKGFDTLFVAYERLCKREAWDVDLVVVGQGAERQRWEARARQANLRERIQFLGFRSDVPRVLRACDLLVAPSRYEPYGMGVHEALCTGIPAIVSRAAGVAERYGPDLEPLVLPDPEDVEGLVDRLRQWQADQSRFLASARMRGEELRRYVWDEMGARMQDLIEE